MSLFTAVGVRSVGLFVVAGLCESGGSHLVWPWLRAGRGLVLGLLGGVVCDRMRGTRHVGVVALGVPDAI